MSNSEYFLVGCQKAIFIFDKSGNVENMCEGHTKSVSCLVQLDDETFCSGSRDGTIKTSGKEGAVNMMDYHSASSLLFCAVDDEVQVWDMVNYELSFNLIGEIQVLSLAVIGRKYLLTGEYNSIKVWDYRAQRMVHTIPIHDFFVNQCVYFEKCRVKNTTFNNVVAITTRASDIHVFRLSDARKLGTIRAHRDDIHILRKMMGKRKMIVSAGKDAKIKMWELRTLACPVEFEGHVDVINDVKIIDVGYEEENLMVLSGSNDGTVKLWDPETGRCVRTIDVAERVCSVCYFASTGRLNMQKSSKKGLFSPGKKVRTKMSTYINNIDMTKDEKLVFKKVSSRVRSNSKDDGEMDTPRDAPVAPRPRKLSSRLARKLELKSTIQKNRVFGKRGGGNKRGKIIESSVDDEEISFEDIESLKKSVKKSVRDEEFVKVKKSLWEEEVTVDRRLYEKQKENLLKQSELIEKQNKRIEALAKKIETRKSRCWLF